MKIRCPNCSATLSLGQPAPGRYKPKCKSCGERFILEVSNEDPPKLRIGKAEPSKRPSDTEQPGSSKPSAPRPLSRRPSPPVDEAVDSVVTAPQHADAAPQRAEASATMGETKAAFEQTMDQTVDTPSARLPSTVAKKDNNSGSVGDFSVKVGAGKKSQTRSNVTDASSRGSTDSSGDSSTIPAKLGGYRILRMLGRGAMGAVYQARQVSLDRDVALKTIRGRLANNPTSLARFTREAYAAAQLTHHNVVQIYDFGEDNGQHYFSMEWVRGGTLSDLVREKGCIDPKLAAGYIAQAARGLQFAHRSGMVHRDVKPGNLLLSEDGVVKVADLGLVKIPDELDPESSGDEMASTGSRQSGTQVTLQGSAVGTPAYMAPEQSSDATSVDHRADIYSLGCSLFYLLAGRSPYDGTVVSEVLEKHASAPLPDLSDINHRVPAPLVRAVERAMAKRADDRYPSLAEMIKDLEDFLGIESTTGFSPSSDQADRWEAIAAAYAKSQVRMRFASPLAWTLITIAALMTLVVPFYWLQGILLGPSLLLAAIATAIGLEMSSGGNAVASHLRRWIGTLSWYETGVGIFATVVVLAVTLVSGLWLGVLVGIVFGAALGAVYHFAIHRVTTKNGSTALEDARKFVRDLRINGAEETGLRDFLARYAGKSWQTVFEALFGYDSLVQMRLRLKDDAAFGGPTEGRSLRDRVCKWLAAKVDDKQHQQQQAKLAKVEKESLISMGVSEADAQQRGWVMAGAIMENAQMPIGATAQSERAAADAKRARIKAMLAEARSGRYKTQRDYLAPVKLAFSGYSRMIAGSLLLAIFALAAQATGLLNEDTVREMRQQVQDGSLNLETLPSDATTDSLGRSTSVWSVGVAGLLLCCSAFVSGWRMSPFAIVATLVILFGAGFGVPAVGSIPAWIIAVGVGAVIYVPGILFGERQ
ncbi:MAG: protein kinase [Planctomycetota bacterium]